MTVDAKGYRSEAGTDSRSSRRIWTIGHSNRSLEAFLELLDAVGIGQIADVRRFPGSRRHPHFNGPALREALADRDIGYDHIPGLGGRRGKPAENSPNTAWRVASFAAYADYMATEAFARALTMLEDLAGEKPTAMMCSEALPWQCHRRLIADALIVQGWKVLDIISPTKVEPRTLTEFATIRNGALQYSG